MARRKFSDADLSFNFGYNVKPKKPKPKKAKKASKTNAWQAYVGTTKRRR